MNLLFFSLSKKCHEPKEVFLLQFLLITLKVAQELIDSADMVVVVVVVAVADISVAVKATHM
jgi:hypothetical protein